MKSFVKPIPPVALLLSLLLFNLCSECHSINQGTKFVQEFFTKEVTDRFTNWIRSGSLPSLPTNSGGDRGCGNHCGQEKYDFNRLVPGFVLVVISYFLLFLLTTAVTGGRRRRALVVSSAKNDQNLQGISNFMIS